MEKVRGYTKKTVLMRTSGYCGAVCLVAAGLMLLTETESARSQATTPATESSKSRTAQHMTRWYCLPNKECNYKDANQRSQVVSADEAVHRTKTQECTTNTDEPPTATTVMPLTAGRPNQTGHTGGTETNGNTPGVAEPDTKHPTPVNLGDNITGATLADPEAQPMILIR